MPVSYGVTALTSSRLTNGVLPRFKYCPGKPATDYGHCRLLAGLPLWLRLQDTVQLVLLNRTGRDGARARYRTRSDDACARNRTGATSVQDAVQGGVGVTQTYARAQSPQPAPLVTPAPADGRLPQTPAMRQRAVPRSTTTSAAHGPRDAQSQP